MAICLGVVRSPAVAASGNKRIERFPFQPTAESTNTLRMNTSDETLIVVTSPTTLAEVERRWFVVQSYPPRIAILRASVEQVQGIKGIVVLDPAKLEATESAIKPPLSETERFFVNAWLLGRQAKPSRKGEGLPWDAPGYLPP